MRGGRGILARASHPGRFAGQDMGDSQGNRALPTGVELGGSLGLCRYQAEAFPTWSRLSRLHFEDRLFDKILGRRWRLATVINDLSTVHPIEGQPGTTVQAGNQQRPSTETKKYHLALPR